MLTKHTVFVFWSVLFYAKGQDSRGCSDSVTVRMLLVIVYIRMRACVCMGNNITTNNKAHSACTDLRVSIAPWEC